MEAIREMFTEMLETGRFSLNFTADGLGVLVYVLQALALYTIAQRRGIKKPWLAWIPVVNVWILGSVSDQYQYVVKRQVKNKRKVLLWLNVAMSVLAAVVLIATVWVLMNVLMLSFGGLANVELTDTMIHTLVEGHLGTILLICLLALPLAVLSIVHTIFFYMAVYDVFRSCEPKNSTLYLVLSLVGNVVISGAVCIFLILCKDKDLGMPPRKPETVEEIPKSTEE